MPIYPHDLPIGADVYSSDGQKLGSLQRAVLKRSDLTLTHIVVDIGFLRSGRAIWQGGFGLEYDRVVPLDVVATVEAERVDLALDEARFMAMPEYTDESFEPPHDLTPDEFDIPDVVTRLQNLAAIVNSTGNTWLHERLNKPLDSVDVAEGTDVWRREPHEKLGEIEHLIFDEPTGRLRAFVVKRGFLLHSEVVLPARYAAEVLDGIVRVDISDEELAQLKPYEAS